MIVYIPHLKGFGISYSVTLTSPYIGSLYKVPTLSTPFLFRDVIADIAHIFVAFMINLVCIIEKSHVMSTLIEDYGALVYYVTVLSSSHFLPAYLMTSRRFTN